MDMIGDLDVAGRYAKISTSCIMNKFAAVTNENKIPFLR